MTTILAYFNGRVFVPENAVNLPVGTQVEIPIAAQEEDESPFADLLRIAERFPSDPATPRDFASQHDHYLHGLPRDPKNDFR